MLVLWSGTNFHMTSGVHSQKPHSSKPSKPICLARATSLTAFVLFATPVAGWVSRLGYIFRAPLPPFPHFCRFWLVLLAAVLLLAAFVCFVVVVVVVLLYAVLLWSTLSPNEMGRSRSPLYYYYYYYISSHCDLDLETASCSFHMILWPIMLHHDTKFGHKRFSSCEGIIKMINHWTLVPSLWPRPWSQQNNLSFSKHNPAYAIKPSLIVKGSAVHKT